MAKNLIGRWKDHSFVLQMKESIKAVFIDKASHQPTDLNGIIVGLDGAIPELISADFCDANLSNHCLRHTKISCSFSDGVFLRVDFGFSFFDTCRFIKSQFNECSFDNAKLSSPTLDDASFENCTFYSAKIYGRGFSEYGGRRIKFDKCSFKNCLFKNVHIIGCKFIDCNFDGVLFDTCIITGTSFLGSTAPPSAFSRCEGQIPQ